VWPIWLIAVLAMLCGCGPNSLPATVEGTLRVRGQPLDNCLVVFLSESVEDVQSARSSGVTDEQGRYRLRSDDLRDGAAVGSHRVIVEDLSVASGVHRRDHGEVDAEHPEVISRPPVRRSRVPDTYGSTARTPLRREVAPGHQVIDLELN
jgi:hypothetical protein